MFPPIPRIRKEIHPCARSRDDDGETGYKSTGARRFSRRFYCVTAWQFKKKKKMGALKEPREAGGRGYQTRGPVGGAGAAPASASAAAPQSAPAAAASSAAVPPSVAAYDAIVRWTEKNDEPRGTLGPEIGEAVFLEAAFKAERNVIAAIAAQEARRSPADPYHPRRRGDDEGGR